MLIEVIFYSTFKEKLQLIKELKLQRCTIEVFSRYLYVTRTINMN